MTISQPLSERARKRGLYTVLADTFLVYGGFFMVIPLISVHYVDRLGWSAALIGLALGIRQLMQQGLTPISGILADRIGVKWLICSGVFLRAIGFIALSRATSFPVLMVAMVLAALGGSMFESPKSAAIAALTDATTRNRFYSLLGVIGGLGIALGTQVGALLLGVDFSLVALLSAACFFVDFFVTVIFLPPVRVAAEGSEMTRGIKLALRDRPFMLYNILLMGYWFIWVQFSISMPLVAKSVSGTTSSISWIYGINSGMTVLLGYPVLRLAERWLRPLPMLTVGLATMAFGFGGVGLAHTLPQLLFCVVLISSGTLLATPSQQTVTASLSNPAALGSYFGVNSLALALGGGVGNFAGGVLYEVGAQASIPALPWEVFLCIGLASTVGFVVMARRSRQVREDTVPAMPVVVPAS